MTTGAVNMTAMLADAVKASDETDTTKTASTPPSSDSGSSTSTLADEEQQLQTDDCHQYDEAVLMQLARQLEYYFSKANLEKDTYVETLRQLNDGYVPAAILVRFSKVQALVPLDPLDAIIKAAGELSSLLEVVPIDSKKGKKADGEIPGVTILAVGPCSGEPLDLSPTHVVTSAVASPTVSSSVQNTIIIREVDSRVTEEEVRALFEDDACPPVQNLHLDVANCWFVTLDTTSRDDMLFVMMHLRTKMLGDEPVKARLKSLVRKIDPAAAPILPPLTSVNSYTQILHMNPNGTNNNKSKKKKERRKPKKDKTKTQGNSKGGASNNNRASTGSDASPKSKRRQPEPDLSEEFFPALAVEHNDPKVEVDVADLKKHTAPKQGSDSASTATTLSSSESSALSKKQMGGYAAALLKAKAAPAVNKVNPSRPSTSGVAKNSQNGQEAAKSVPKQIVASDAAKAPIVKAPTWGGGRSFADVLRKEDTPVEASP